jgi:hypothetical protein
MLAVLRTSGKLSPRKIRLFAVGCCRRVWPFLVDDRSRKAVEVAEGYADRLVDESERASAEAAASEAARASPMFAALASKMTIAKKVPVHRVVIYTPVDLVNRPEDTQARNCEQAHLLRDLFGPWLFRPVTLSPSVRTWNDGCVVKLATAIYEERSLPEGTLSSVRLRVLADALEDAGVTGPDILGHLRQQRGVHVRGCWAIDLLTGRA